MSDEVPTVETFTVYSDLSDGREHCVRRTFFGPDHETVVAQTVESFTGSTIRIREILSFDGPPRRWSPTYGAKEKP